MMDAFTAVASLFAVRRYRRAPIPFDDLRRVLEAARLTGSGHNLQPWHFILITEGEQLRRIGTLASHGPYIAEAAACIAVLVHDGSELAVIDGARAMQSMLLVSWSLGIGANWVTPMPEELPALRELLAVPPGWRLLAFMPLGYPAGSRPRRRKARKPLREIASLGRFGEPLPVDMDSRDS